MRARHGCARRARRTHGCDARDGHEVWTHVRTDRGSLYQGFKKHTSTVEHDFDVRLGLVVEQRFENREGPSLRRVERVALEVELFEAPDGYEEVLTDDELLAGAREAVGWAEMLPGTTLHSAGPRHVGAPNTLDERWHAIRERWMFRGPDSAVVVKISSAEAVEPRPVEAPLEITWDLRVDAWDDEAEVGEYSHRLSDTEILFAERGRVFRVEIHPETLADQLLPLCAALSSSLD